jgi:putative membrane protein
MGGMMGATGTTGAWILLWILLALAVGVTSGIVIARSLRARHCAALPQIPPAESPAVREAKDALRLRYANGEISREEYLQGKVELED